MNLLITGAPGTGKGTMSNLIVETYKVVHVSTGDMLRAAIAKGTPVGQKAAEYMNNGKLVPDSIIHDIIVERLKDDDMKQGFLLDGYPRTYAQAVDFDQIMKELGMKIDLVIDLDLDEEILESRIVNRRICKNCGKIYHLINFPPKVADTCDDCGNTLSQRKDDTKESLRIRLDEYHRNTEPVIEYYSGQGILKHVSAADKSEVVFENIRALIEGR